MKKIPLNLIYLKYFCDAARHASISRSARINHVSQSAVSQGIGKLEESLGTLLISHQPNRFKLTECGKRLFENSTEVFKSIQKAEDEVGDTDRGTITFGCTHSFALTCLPKYLKLAQTYLPKVRINFCLGHYFNIKEWIKKGTIDFGILLDNDDLSSFDCHPLHRGLYRLYTSNEAKEPKDLHFLLDSEERIETNILKANYKAQFGKDLPVLMQVSSWSVVATLVREGFGIGLCPDYIAGDDPSLKAVFPELNPMSYTLHALFEKHRSPHSHALIFLDLFRKFPIVAPNP
jgi:DNA-binding transcriptional LysR family regulator